MQRIMIKKEVISPKKERVADFNPTLKVSNVLDYLGEIFQYETAKKMNDSGPIRPPKDPHRLACMLAKTEEAEKKAREEAESQGLTYWIDRAEYIRRQMALKTRQHKESEKIAIVLSNQLDVARQEQENLKQEHIKAISFMNNKMNKFIEANENLSTDISTLKRQITDLERKNLSLESVNVRILVDLKKEVNELKKNLIERDHEIAKLKSLKDAGDKTSPGPEVKTANTKERNKIYLDGYPIELDFSSDDSASNGQNELKENDDEDSENDFVDTQQEQDDVVEVERVNQFRVL